MQTPFITWTKNHLLKKTYLLLLGVSSIACVMLFLLFIGIQTWRIANSIQKLQFTKAATQAKISRYVIKPVSFLTFRQVAEIEITDLVLKNISNVPHTVEKFSQAYQASLQQETPDQELHLSQILQEITTDLKKIDQQCQKSVINKFLALPPCQHINTLAPFLNDFTQVTSYFSQGKHEVIVLLQNNHELRATGGFIGSFATISIENGIITTIRIDDIYEPDGQFSGFIVAPPGVKEFLSSGKGLRLPDANWHPDFPSSCQQILRFFALGNRTQIDGVVAINLSLIENILGITGGIPLFDYGVTVNRDNISSLARAERSEFFAGSYQKPNFLNALFTHLKIRIESLPPQKMKELITTLQTAVETKDIMIYSTNDQVQSVFEKYQLSGNIPPLLENATLSNTLEFVTNTPNTSHKIPDLSSPSVTPDLFYLFESNVGINKANKHISREVTIDIEDYRTTVTILFANNNIPGSTIDHDLGYVNYQRLLIPETYHVESLFVDGQELEKNDISSILNIHQLPMKQIGFLVTVPIQKQTLLQITLSHPPLASPLQLLIPKQPGLPSTPYQIHFNDTTTSFLLEKNTFVQFP